MTGTQPWESTNEVPPQVRPYKFVIQPILQVVHDGEVIGEKPADPVTVYGLKGLDDFLKKAPAQIAALNRDPNA